MPIEYPDIEIRNEARLAADSIARVSGGLTADIVNAQIETRRELLKLIADGLDAPICPELTNANPSSPHTVLLEAFAWALAQGMYRFNRVPEQNFIAFANLFGIERRLATFAETTLTFTVAPPLNTAVTIPIGTEVTTADGLYVFQTAAALVIPYGTPTGSVLARRTVNGHTLLQPEVLTELIDPVAFVTGVTNLNAIDSGTALESIESVLERVKRFQRRGERIVSTKDLEEAILEDGLAGNGIVRAFPFVRNGEFGSGQPLVGHTTVVVMTRTGENIDATATQRIAVLLDTAVGNQFIYLVNPTYVEFDVTASIKLSTGSPSDATVALVETNLRNFYAASRENFGRPILRSEIIAVIEGTAGVDRIEVPESGVILASPLVDTKLVEYQLPKLGDVTITVV